VTLKTEVKLLEICDEIAGGLSYNSSARACGVAPRTLFQWMKQSNAGDEDFIIEYLGERMQFSQALAFARKALHMEARSRFERRSALGHDEKVFFQGMPTWVEDERTVGWTPDEREAFGFERDGLLRDERGFRVQHTIHHEPPIAAALRVLEMSFGEEYTPTVNTNVINKDTGVLQVPRAGEKVAIPPKPVRPQLEYQPDEGSDGPEPVQAIQDADDEPNYTPSSAPVDPGPVIKEPTPSNLNPLIDPQRSAALAADFARKLPSDNSAVRAALKSKVPTL
jgi:hypothetical protein